MGIPISHPAIQAAIEKGLIPRAALAPKPVPPGAAEPKPEKPELVAASFEPPGTWTVPLYVVAGDNARGMRSKIGRAGHERRVTARVLASALAALVPFAEAAQAGRKVRCRLVRLGRTGMDSDGLAGACKYARDTVALFLGVGDGPRGPVAWEYDQSVGGPFGVRIELSTEGAKA